jgi:hypothetical protein
MQLNDPLFQPISYKKSQNTKIAYFQAPKPILDDVNPNTDTMMMFLSSPLAQTKEYLGNVSNISSNLGRSKTTIFVKTSMEK